MDGATNNSVPLNRLMQAYRFERVLSVTDFLVYEIWADLLVDLVFIGLLIQ